MTFTKEQLIKQAQKNIAVLRGAVERIPGASEAAVIHLRLAEITLAALTAEPVGEVVLGEYDDSGCHPDARVACIAADGQADWGNFKDGTRLYTAPPAPVSVPDELAKRIPEILRTGKANRWEIQALAKSCRAAMLQGAEPVTTTYKLPEPIKDHRLNSGPEADDYYAGYQAGWNELLESVSGNSPVIPDDVRRMDWLASKTVDVREPMVYGSHSLFWSQTITDEEDDYHATKLREQIDAAMAAENAAAPQQEVK